MKLAPLEPDRLPDQDRLLRCRQVEQAEIALVITILPCDYQGRVHGPKTMPFQPEIAASLKNLFESIAEMEGRQRDASLSQVWRTPSDRLCQFLLTTSQFTIGRCSALLWVAEAEVRVVEASDT
jgi:hypothetical protein